jgi:hypothetical protein
MKDKGIVHQVVRLGAIAGAAALLWAMLFGGGHSLEESLHVDRNLRDIAIALWAFLLPAWFTIEELWFSPAANDKGVLEKFRADQNKARQTLVIVAGAVAIIIGATAPSASTNYKIPLSASSTNTDGSVK